MASKLTKKINSQFNPVLLSGYPVYAYGGKMNLNQYAFGSWLKSNVGNIAQTALGAGAMAIPGLQGVGTGLLTPGIGGMVTTGDSIGKQQEAQIQAQQEEIKRQLISNLPAQHYYQPTFAMGGKMYQDGGGIKQFFQKYPTPLHLLNKRIYNTVSAGGGYSDRLSNIVKSAIDVLSPTSEKVSSDSADQEIFGYSLGQLPLNNLKYWESSKYTPSISREENTNYIAPVIPDEKKGMLVEYYLGNFNPTEKDTSFIAPRFPGFGGVGDSNDPLANHKISFSKDSKGRYMSMYDKWDFKNPLANFFLTKKPEIYDRYYYKENPDYHENPDRLINKLDSLNNRYKDIKDLRKKYILLGGEFTDKMNNPDGSYTQEFLDISKDELETLNRIINTKDSINKFRPSPKYIINKEFKNGGQLKNGGKISHSEIAKGIKEEMEHTSYRKISKKTAMDHLKEDPKYYTKLKEAGLADSYAFGGLYNSYAGGGSIYIDPSKRGTFKAQASKMGMSVQEAASKILNAPEGKYSPAMRKKANFAKNFAKAEGGYIEEYTNGDNLDNTTIFANGGQHESNPVGGIPQGQNALVEEGEVRFKDYIFSNRIPYTKKK